MVYHYFDIILPKLSPDPPCSLSPIPLCVPTSTDPIQDHLRALSLSLHISFIFKHLFSGGWHTFFYDLNTRTTKSKLMRVILSKVECHCVVVWLGIDQLICITPLLYTHCDMFQIWKPVHRTTLKQIRTQKYCTACYLNNTLFLSVSFKLVLW
jgi:hypothetical protein